MKIRYCLWIFTYSFLLICNALKGQELAQTVYSKGYLLIAGEEEIVFFPDSSANLKIDFKKLKSIKGIKLVGTTAYNYDIYRISKIARKLPVKVRFFTQTDSSYMADHQIQVLPVIARINRISGLDKQEAGFTFQYKGQTVCLMYTANFDYHIGKMEPLSKKEMKRFRQYKE